MSETHIQQVTRILGYQPFGPVDENWKERHREIYEKYGSDLWDMLKIADLLNREIISEYRARELFAHYLIKHSTK